MALGLGRLTVTSIRLLASALAGLVGRGVQVSLGAGLIAYPLLNGVLFTVTVGLRQHGTSATVIGLVQAAIMTGGVLGAPVAPLLQRRLRPSTLTLTMILAGALLFAVAAVVFPSPLVALPVAFVVLLAPAGNSGLFASALRQAPEEMRGRVTSTVTATAMSLAALAPLLAGLLIEHSSAPGAMGAFAGADALAAVLALVMPGLRDADSPPAQSASA